MKSSIREETYREIYSTLNEVSPVAFDCGMICGQACCEVVHGEVETGMFLLPGEEKVHDRYDSWLTWSSVPVEECSYPDSWKGRVYFVQCCGPEHCHREKRPIQCRTYPVLPHMKEDGTLCLVYNDIYLRYSCPLIETQTPLQESFLRATLSAWRTLIRDPLIRDMVEADSMDRGQMVEIVWEKNE